MKRRTSLRAWIRANREALDAVIQRLCPGARRSDEERRLWVLNDEGLYNWARAERVNV
jgi:hypothetical protein